MQHSHRGQEQKEKMSVSPEEAVVTHIHTHMCTYAHEHTHRHTCVHSWIDLADLIGSSDTQIKARSKLIQSLHSGSWCSTSVHTWLNLQTSMTGCILLFSAFCSWRNSSKMLITVQSVSGISDIYSWTIGCPSPWCTRASPDMAVCGTRSPGSCWLHFYSY